MKLLIFALLSICAICIASGVQQLGHPEGKVIDISSILSNNITNLPNMTKVSVILLNDTHLDLSEHNASLSQLNMDESVMETPSEAQSDFNK